jgi:hypothetical protein
MNRRTLLAVACMMIVSGVSTFTNAQPSFQIFDGKPKTLLIEGHWSWGLPSGLDIVLKKYGWDYLKIVKVDQLADCAISDSLTPLKYLVGFKMARTNGRGTTVTRKLMDGTNPKSRRRWRSAWLSILPRPSGEAA